MTTAKERNGDDDRAREARSKDEPRGATAPLDALDDLDLAVRKALVTGKDVAVSVGGSIRETLKSVRTSRSSVVMVRLSKESLQRLDDLVDCGVTNSRSEAAAFLIIEGVRARADLYDKIAEQSEIIRKAREELSRLIDQEEKSATSTPTP